jgi:uncharacterized protein YciI
MFIVDMTFIDVNQITVELTGQHRAYLKSQYDSGVLMFGGRKVPRTGGILVSLHQDKNELIQMLSADPLIQSGLVKYTTTEIMPVMASADYQQLLNDL